MTYLGYLGPQGTHSHAIALSYAAEHGYKVSCCHSLADIFEQIKNGRLKTGIIPVENSTGGSVGETLDLMLAYDNIYIRAELLHPVRHHLLARPGVSVDKIEKVYSHPQALAQCSKFISEFLPGAEVIETSSTAAAALEVANAAANHAAIGSETAAAAYKLIRLKSDVQNSNQNVTRFMVIGKDRPSFTGPAKTSLALAVLDSPGALCRILKEFALRAINLTRIESRPAGSKLGDYIFFIDLAARVDDPVVQDALDNIKHSTLWVKYLGCYPACEDMKPEYRQKATGYSNLAALREKIDLVDDEIMYLLAMRQRLVDRVAGLKKCPEEVLDQSRETAVINRVMKLAGDNNLNAEMVVNIYRLMMMESVCRQKMQIAARHR